MRYSEPRQLLQRLLQAGERLGSDPCYLLANPLELLRTHPRLDLVQIHRLCRIVMKGQKQVCMAGVGYLCAVLFSMSFFDASTKFQPRILAPIYVCLLVLLVAFGSGFSWGSVLLRA